MLLVECYSCQIAEYIPDSYLRYPGVTYDILTVNMSVTVRVFPTNA